MIQFQSIDSVYKNELFYFTCDFSELKVVSIWLFHIIHLINETAYIIVCKRNVDGLLPVILSEAYVFLKVCFRFILTVQVCVELTKNEYETSAIN